MWKKTYFHFIQKLKCKTKCHNSKMLHEQIISWRKIDPVLYLTCFHTKYNFQQDSPSSFSEYIKIGKNLYVILGF